jgi:hypothetical protein
MMANAGDEIKVHIVRGSAMLTLNFPAEHDSDWPHGETSRGRQCRRDACDERVSHEQGTCKVFF